MIQFFPDNLMWAQASDNSAGRVVYELSRLREFDNERLFVLAVVAVSIGLIALVSYLYRRDTVETPRSIALLLGLLRCVALGGLLVFFLGIQRRTTHEVVHDSQVSIVVDVSQSMGLADGGSAQDATAATRLDEVVAFLSDSPLFDELRKSHDVNVVRFDRDADTIVSLAKLDRATSSPAGDGNGVPAEAADTPRVDWSEELRPRGTETQIGHALSEQLRLYRDAPLAGLILISDGGQNAGIEPTAAVDVARARSVPIYTIGVGSAEPQRNVSLRDLVVPARTYPGDTFEITAYLQSSGLAGRLVDVELFRRRINEPANTGLQLGAERVMLGADGEILPVRFELEADEPGSFVYQVRVAPPADDGNPRDNAREAQVDVVDRQTRVLLVASGPTRDYRFLRNQVFRDPTMMVDVLLGTAQPGISQEANEILDHFPTTREELFKYDCIVAFDPDWTRLDAAQVALLEEWLSDEAGGMIVVPGPIHTAQWIRSSEHAGLLDLYPVTFQRRFAQLDSGQYSTDSAWPLEFERAGREARFLWLEPTSEDSQAAWDAFPGVYSCYTIKGEKPGATVYARFSDPEADLSGRRPAYMAEQFYGAGRVFYIGSAEMWRLRSLDPSFFEVLYTKLIRHVSQGRLLRGSSRGALLVERDRYELGETAVLRARLADARHQPLERDQVTAQTIRPDGTAASVTLKADVARPGMFIGQLPLMQEGTYQLALPVPDSDEDPLTHYLQVRVPDRERAHAQRNEPLLASLADETGGKYYAQLAAAASGGADVKPITQLIGSRAEVEIVKGAPDRQFAQSQMHWLLGIIAGALFIEWIVRRVNRLA